MLARTAIRSAFAHTVPTDVEFLADDKETIIRHLSVGACVLGSRLVGLDNCH